MNREVRSAQQMAYTFTISLTHLNHHGFTVDVQSTHT